MADIAIFDKNDFGNRLANNTQLMAMVVSEFLKEAKGLVEELSQSVQAADWYAVGRIAHRIKGASAEVSAYAMSSDAREIEFAVKAENISSIPEFFASLEKNYSLLEATLLKEFA